MVQIVECTGRHNKHDLCPYFLDILQGDFSLGHYHIITRARVERSGKGGVIAADGGKIFPGSGRGRPVVEPRVESHHHHVRHLLSQQLP